MRRYGILALLLIFISLMTAYIVGAGEVKGTKHDLSMSVAEGGSGPGPIQSAGGAIGTTEICVFCHTPHSARPDAPLWNRSTATGPYTVYSSDVLNAGTGFNIIADDPSDSSKLNYAIHVKTRICLSCHDGTIALGNLVNMPGNAASFTINNSNAGRIPNTAAGYIDTDLSDDHPVAIKHSWGTDPELKSPAGTKVRLYNFNVKGQVASSNPPQNGDYVECTSCHDAHDNANGNFLVDTNLGSNICLSCHKKEKGTGNAGGVGTLAHDNSAIGYNPDQTAPPALGATVGDVKCMNCHYMHKSGATGAVYPFTKYANVQGGQYLLGFEEENTCFNKPNRWNKTINVCHGQTSSTKDIWTFENKGSAHKDTVTYAGRHRATEQGLGTANYGWLGAGYPNWHVQCNDCHNPHTAGSVSHTQGTNVITKFTSPLYGAGGVQITYPKGTNWSSRVQGDFNAYESLGLLTSTDVPVDYYEYQICFKCHSSFAWGGNPAYNPPSPSLGGLLLMTDQAQEFNTANASFHPVAGPTVNHAGTLSGGWASGQTMYCSDCHADNLGGSKGPHGSNATYGAGSTGFIMTANYTDTYSAIKTDTQPFNDICFNCHPETVYQSGANTLAGTGFSGSGTNLHTSHRIAASSFGSSTFGYRCVNCHTRVPHGYKNKGLIVVKGDGAPYEAGGTGQGKITSISLPGSGAYQVGSANKDVNCLTVAGCHQP